MDKLVQSEFCAVDGSSVRPIANPFMNAVDNILGRITSTTIGTSSSIPSSSSNSNSTITNPPGTSYVLLSPSQVQALPRTQHGISPVSAPPPHLQLRPNNLSTSTTTTPTTPVRNTVMNNTMEEIWHNTLNNHPNTNIQQQHRPPSHIISPPPLPLPTYPVPYNNFLVPPRLPLQPPIFPSTAHTITYPSNQLLTTANNSYYPTQTITGMTNVPRSSTTTSLEWNTSNMNTENLPQNNNLVSSSSSSTTNTINQPSDQDNNELRMHAQTIVNNLNTLNDEHLQQSEFLSMMKEMAKGSITVTNTPSTIHANGYEEAPGQTLNIATSTNNNIDDQIKQQLFGDSNNILNPEDFPLYANTNTNESEINEEEAVQEVRKRLELMQTLWRRALNGENFDIDSEDFNSILDAANSAVQIVNENNLSSNIASTTGSSSTATHPDVVQYFNEEWKKEQERLQRNSNSNTIDNEESEEGLTADMLLALKEEERIAALIEEAWKQSASIYNTTDINDHNNGNTETIHEDGSIHIDNNETILSEYPLPNRETNTYYQQRETMNPFDEGMRLYQAGQLILAIQAFEAVIHQSPDHSEAWRMLGICHAESENDRLAILCLQNSIHYDPYNTAALLQLSVSYVNELNSQQALYTLRAWIRHHPRFHSLMLSTPLSSSSSNIHPTTNTMEDDLFSSSNIHGEENEQENHEIDQVMELLLRAQSIAPGDPDILILLGVVYNVSKDYPSAARAFQQALVSNKERSQTDYDTWNKLGATLARNHNHEHALQAYHHAIEIRPNFARGWFNIGISYYNQQQYKEAAKAYLHALRIHPQATHIWTLLRITFSSMSRFDLVQRTELGDPNNFSESDF